MKDLEWEIKKNRDNDGMAHRSGEAKDQHECLWGGEKKKGSPFDALKPYTEGKSSPNAFRVYNQSY